MDGWMACRLPAFYTLPISFRRGLFKYSLSLFVYFLSTQIDISCQLCSIFLLVGCIDLLYLLEMSGGVYGGG